MSNLINIFYRPDRLGIARSGPVRFDKIAFTSRGNNPKTAEELETLRKHPEFRRYEELGAMSVKQVPEVLPVAADATLPDLSELNASEAAEVITETFDKALLQKWLAVEKRVGVLRELNSRIQDIDAGKG